MTNLSQIGESADQLGALRCKITKICCRRAASANGTKDFRLCRRFRLALKKGEVVALVSDNGSGKSTLVKTIAGAQPPDDGNIFFEGNRVTINSPKEATHLGIATLHQNLGLVGSLNEFKNIFWAAKQSNPADR